MGILDDYRNRKNFKHNFDPDDPDCYSCGSEDTVWKRQQIHTKLGHVTAGLAAKYVEGLKCNDCGLIDARKNKPKRR